MRSILTAITLAGLAAAASTASAQADVSGYVTSSGVTVKNAASNCWRAGYWTPALANAECDPDLVPKAAAIAPPPPPPAPAPKAAAKPSAAPVFERATFSADVFFEFDKAVLRDEGRQQLDKLAGQIAGVNLEVTVIVGHADRIGGKAYNQKLSERRANAVKAYLASKGVPDNRIYAEGKGEAQPVTGNKCAKMGRESGRNAKLVACLQPDRRVEVEVVGTRQK
jgi:OmpA-OmpF porin, OOP family